MQPAARLTGRDGATLGAISTNLKTGHHDVKLAIALDLSFKTVEKIALKFCYFSAAQAGHMDVVALRTAFIEVFFALQMHEIFRLADA
jgi:hypothetical protein